VDYSIGARRRCVGSLVSKQPGDDVKCADCQIDFPMTQLLFVPIGQHPKIAMKTSKAQCKSCSKKIPIDHRVRDRDDEEYPF